MSMQQARPKQQARTKQQARVALITIPDPNDVRAWSGTQYRVYQQLQNHFTTVEPLGPVKLSLFERLIIKVSHKLCGNLLTKYNRIHSLILGYFRARHFSRKLRKQGYDFAFASACAPVAAFLKTPVPVIYLSDATFRLLRGYYEQFTGLNRLSEFEGEYAERHALENAAGVIMSSEWARQSAIDDYGIAPDKVETCLFGANVDNAALADAANNAQRKLARVGNECNLLFLARDWRRKGGRVALEAFFELKRRGYRVTLTVCGCEPEEITKDEWKTVQGLTVIPYLDKGVEEDRARYYELMQDSHFLVLPTVADCTPMVFAEANAYGMPVITANTGGIPSLIQEGENGFLLSPSATGKDYADVIAAVFFEQEGKYEPLTASARQRYEQALNWERWGHCVEAFITRRLAEIESGQAAELPTR